MSRHELMSYIYTEMWKYYKANKADPNIKAFEKSCATLLDEIVKSGDSLAVSFCESLSMTFVPIINEQVHCV